MTSEKLRNVGASQISVYLATVLYPFQRTMGCVGARRRFQGELEAGRTVEIRKSLEARGNGSLELDVKAMTPELIANVLNCLPKLSFALQ